MHHPNQLRHAAAASPPYFAASHASHSKPRQDLQRLVRPDPIRPGYLAIREKIQYGTAHKNWKMLARNVYQKYSIYFRMWYIDIYTFNVAAVKQIILTSKNREWLKFNPLTTLPSTIPPHSKSILKPIPYSPKWWKEQTHQHRNQYF